MKNKGLIVCLLLICAMPVFAQESDLQIQGVSPNLYLLHTVQPKENWYSIGRMYNISPKQLAPYNHESMDKALSVGQSLKIPLNEENFSQDGSKAVDESLVPVKHTIQQREWLYRISVNYNKVPVETLEKWNNISKDQAKAGLNITVGYLRVKSAQSALVAKADTRVAHTAPVPTEFPAAKEPAPKEEKKPVNTVPAVDPTTAKNTSAQTENKPNTAPASNTSTEIKTVSNTTAAPGKEAKSSYFKSQYEESGKSMSGNAGLFKSASGWEDGKFYALVNNVPVGTIVRINNPISGRAVFAKVLGALPEMKESLGLVARISDAAAAALDAGTAPKFSVEIRY
ncbi:MAG: LysM peptidoglycan-binding domain-containing protein [Bacteroidota bacterium]|nr:LysM peptidoglycan-binding domain-containing protein [Bacteroidota bacterium]